VLLITRNAALAATVTALAAPSPPPRVTSPEGLSDVAWARYPLILLDADTADTTALPELRLRSLLIVCTTTDPDPGVDHAARRLGAECTVHLPDGTAWLTDRLHAAHDHPPQRVITVLDVCADPHGVALAAALALAAARTRQDTDLLLPDPHPTALPDLPRDLHDQMRPGDGYLALLVRDPDAPHQITELVVAAPTGGTAILDATPLDTPSLRTAAMLADRTLLVAGPRATQSAALGATADTLAHLNPHHARLELVLARQRPCHTPARHLATQIATAAAHLGWPTPLPVHTFDTTTHTPPTRPPPRPRLRPAHPPPTHTLTNTRLVHRPGAETGPGARTVHTRHHEKGHPLHSLTDPASTAQAHRPRAATPIPGKTSP
jgi:hypothetical protein